MMGLGIWSHAYIHSRIRFQGDASFDARWPRIKLDCPMSIISCGCAGIHGTIAMMIRAHCKCRLKSFKRRCNLASDLRLQCC